MEPAREIYYNTGKLQSSGIDAKQKLGAVKRTESFTVWRERLFTALLCLS